MNVNTQSPEVAAMSEDWEIITPLMGGTRAMRAAGQRLLPKEPREDDEDWRYRNATATLFPAYQRTIGVMAAKPFSRELTLTDENSDRIKALAMDIDQMGNSLHVFAGELTGEVLAYGIAGVLVDYSRVNGPVRTQADSMASGARPYWVLIKHDQVLGWRSERVNGSERLTMLRLTETVTEDDGEWGSKDVEQVRVLRRGIWELYRKNERGDFALFDEGATTLPLIPYVPFYGCKTGFMTGKPPLANLAYQNVKHFQHQSDQDDSARFARKRLLIFTGMDEQSTLTAASGYALKLPQGADGKVVQGSSESVAVGRTELEALEAQMIQTGAELLVARPGQRTATEAGNDAEANKSELLRIVEGIEDGLDQCLQFTADWLGAPEESGNVSLFKDFSASTLTEASNDLLLRMNMAGKISDETLFAETKRRGLISAERQWEDERDALESQGPVLTDVGQ